MKSNYIWPKQICLENKLLLILNTFWILFKRKTNCFFLIFFNSWTLKYWSENALNYRAIQFLYQIRWNKMILINWINKRNKIKKNQKKKKKYYKNGIQGYYYYFFLNLYQKFQIFWIFLLKSKIIIFQNEEYTILNFFLRKN